MCATTQRQQDQAGFHAWFPALEPACFQQMAVSVRFSPLNSLDWVSPRIAAPTPKWHNARCSNATTPPPVVRLGMVPGVSTTTAATTGGTGAHVPQR